MKNYCCSRWAAAAIVVAAASFVRADSSIKVAGVGGAVLLSDNQTLVVSITPEATLLYFDTAAEKELKRVELDFKPTALALQGDKLFAGAAGASAVHVLNPDTGKEVKVIKIPGEPIQELACHPEKGLLYATTTGSVILGFDLEKGLTYKTPVKGQMLAVDPVDGNFVYAGIQKPIKDTLVFEEHGSRTTLSMRKANERALLLKYAVHGKNLKLVAVNDNAAINGRRIALSPDGKLIAMAGGGGWQSKSYRKRVYGVPVFETSNMVTQAGLVETGPYPGGVAFHPVLKLGVAYHAPQPEVIVFSTKSFAKKESLKLPKSGDPIASLAYLGFGAKGTKVVYALAAGPGPNGAALLGVASLKLKDEDLETLKKAYSK